MKLRSLSGLALGLAACNSSSSPAYTSSETPLVDATEAIRASGARLYVPIETQRVALAPTCDGAPNGKPLTVEANANVRGFAPDLSSVVTSRREYGRDYNLTLQDVRSGVRAHVDGVFIAYVLNGERALFTEYAPNGVASFIEVTPSTADRTTIAKGEYQLVQASTDGRTLLLQNLAQELWIYFADTQRLQQLSDTSRSFGENLFVSKQTETVALATTDGFAIIDLKTQKIESFPGNTLLAFVEPGVVGYADRTNTLWAWRPDRPPLRLGASEGMRWPAASARGDRLVMEGLTVRLWNAAQHTVREVATNALSAILSGDGTKVLVERTRTGDSEFSLIDLDTGNERVVLRLPRYDRGVLSSNGRYLAINERVDPADPDNGDEYARLFDLLEGHEIQLQTSYTTDTGWYGYIQLGFHDGGSVLHVVYGAYAEVVFDTATGAHLYESSRSVSPSEGHYSYWPSHDHRLFTRAGGYQADATDLYVWDTRDQQERFVGPGMARRCSWGERDVLYQGALYRGMFDAPFQLVSWNADTHQKWTISTTIQKEIACFDNRVLFHENGGRLAFADVETEQLKILSERATSYQLDDKHVVFTNSTSICAVPLK